MQIFVVRHGLSQANVEGVIQGYSDSPLSDTGRAQADLLGRYLQREGIVPEIIFSSPLRRAHETAQIISAAIKPQPPVEPVDGLKEVDVGELSGLSLEDAFRKYPDRWAPDVNQWLDFSNFSGESKEQLFERVDNAVMPIMQGWDDLLADRTILFVTHAGAMRPLLKHLLGARGDLMFFTFGNCCHARLEYREVRDDVRRVLSDLVRIEKVAALMGEKAPLRDVEDPVGRGIG